jgi:hypothetical protein
MSESGRPVTQTPRTIGVPRGASAAPQPASLADVLDRVLDKGIVIAGDVKVNLLDIELLTIKIRLLVASVDKAKEMGIDWWQHDPMLSSRAQGGGDSGQDGSGGEQDRRSLEQENQELRARIEALEAGRG